MRIFRVLLILCFLFNAFMPASADAARGKAPRTGEADPRYAALIMNPQTGEIYHSRNADARRYPASLTKMMTLYLLFEDLEAKKITMNTKFSVSPYAASQPQTNISLSVRDKLPMDTVIKSLIIRSANDVSVVVAENLNGSVSAFATRMTNKARALGMNSTVFKNPHGLPNDAQYTTARDMAKLGIALKRDFPQYYHYFSARQFSWKGATYYTHNRVMTRYSGTDGIKTGFINKSGFNVVTSTTRGGRPLIGVVMGGASGAWRDTKMISLLDQGYKIIASRGQKSGRIYAANLPAPRAGTAQVAQQAKPATAPAASLPVAVSVTRPPVSPSAGVEAGSASPAPNTLDAQLAARQGGLTQPGVSEGVWGIQVGAFSSQALAEQAVRQAYQQALPNLQGSRMAVIGAGQPGGTIHRARLENLSETQAKKACELLISRNSPCFIFRADAQNL
jgi:D-alanyl-D-alanine carboxypeptidase